MNPLVRADALASLPNLVLLDARPDPAAYAAGHLHGAQHADLARHLSAVDDPRRGGRHPLPSIERWTQQLGAWGITPESNVVIYDDADASNAAARTWWMLRAAGHERAFVLDGGMRDLPLTSSSSAPAPAPPYPVTSWQLTTVDMPTVDRLRNDASWRVLDVRSRPRYRGETEPIDPIAGHIPGAINLPFAENMQNGRFKSPEELRAQYQSLFGDVPPERVIVHCGSGVTACHTLLALEAAGLRGAALYVGSWSEWCRNEEMPRATEV
ncbi:MAG TPA: rhodanese-like domain-containing protein [Thermoanaerobaculia bacterium]|nr:rhodanese-like domain-containing protein [Thermoanaerobaculia bacterium]